MSTYSELVGSSLRSSLTWKEKGIKINQNEIERETLTLTLKKTNKPDGVVVCK